MSSAVLTVSNIVWHAELVAPQAGKFVEKPASAHKRLRDRSKQLRSLIECETGGRTFSNKPLSQRAFLNYDGGKDVIDEHEGNVEVRGRPLLAWSSCT